MHSTGGLCKIQGSIKCFDLKSGEVVKRRVFKVIPLPVIFVKIANNWGMKYKKENRKKSGITKTPWEEVLLGQKRA